MHQHARQFQCTDLNGCATAFTATSVQIGFVEGATGKALVLGEYGGSDIGKDAQLQKALADYLHNNCISDSFLW
jgi:hypothetical protein